MSPVSAIPAVIAFAVALSVAAGIQRVTGRTGVHGRYGSIDGLRGYLAFCVFLHHSCIWYFQLHTGIWQAPPSNFYNHLGQTSVLFFFMITSLLFFSKILDAPKNNFDWLRLTVSRILRIVPLYLVATAGMIILTFHATGWTAHDAPAALAAQISRRLLFQMPQINGFAPNLVDASVTWTLSYEWLFYLSLPFLGLVAGARPPAAVLMLAGALMTIGVLGWSPSPLFVLPFLGGMLAAGLARVEGLRRLARRRIASVVAVGCVVLAVATHSSAFGVGPIALLTVAFCIVAGGNTLFGALTNSAARWLGEISYSLYLLHGMILFSLFTIILDPETVREWSPSLYWSAIIAVVPAVLGISFATFRLIERPGIRKTAAATAWLRSRWPLPPGPVSEEIPR